MNVANFKDNMPTIAAEEEEWNSGKETDEVIQILFQILTIFHPCLESEEKMQCRAVLSCCLVEGMTLTKLFEDGMRKAFILRMLSDEEFPTRHNMIDMAGWLDMWNLITILEDDYAHLWDFSDVESEAESDSEDEEAAKVHPL
mmetsp:Transcript_3051/g.3788  ORF Transcript_3051/g.3788 Transcript_3051/m.3788 type:complete len:143 (+) Transcript_3051:96-524(+)